MGERGRCVEAKGQGLLKHTSFSFFFFLIEPLEHASSRRLSFSMGLTMCVFRIKH